MLRKPNDPCKDKATDTDSLSGPTRMILKFPDLATLRLALIAGAVPPAVGASPATAGSDEGAALWLETPAALPRAAQNDLKRLGVQIARANGATATTPVNCWAELLPLQADPGQLVVTEQTPVLFELSDGVALASLIAEVLRLGNDRQSFRWLGDDDGATRALLRVVGPPYYSLLRAVDRIGAERAPAAFVERAPRVWVELGQTHPLAEHLKPSSGKILLLRAPRQWTLLDDAPFRDVYEVLEFTLPDMPARWSDRPPADQIRVKPTLRPGGSPDGAELWVLREGALEALNRFVQHADDQLLHRLAFAVGQRDGHTTVVVRVRQARQAPPVVVLEGEAYKHYLKLPNLFLPVGTRLHPPLRRDVVRKLLADDPAQLTWLAPGESGAFAPEGLPEDAFRPLADWVEYVLDRDRQPLQAWVQAAQFDFESFVCADDQPAKTKKPGHGARGPKGKQRSSGDEAADPTAFAPPKVRKGSAPPKEEDPFADVVRVEPSEAQQQLTALQEHFLGAEGGLDAPERVALWPKLAALNAALGSGDDAGVCWMNAIWNVERTPPAWAWSWFRAEAAAVPIRGEKGHPKGRSWVSRLTIAGAKDRELSADDLDRLLALEEPAAADVRVLAAYLVHAGTDAAVLAARAIGLDRIQRFLEAHERLLPVRAVWLAWSSVARLAGGDVLGLARVRDRLLGRLFADGLRPEQDLPTFLRFAGEAGGQRYRAVRPWLTQLCERARKWVERQGQDSIFAPRDARTPEYVDLLFAFGLGRVGEGDASRQLLRRAEVGLAAGDDAHQLMLNGFRYRIEQALGGKPHGGPLPTDLLEYLEVLSRDRQSNQTDLRYVVDRMRAISRVLEPDQQINPYRRVYAKVDGDVARELALLPDLLDAAEVTAQVDRLLRDPPHRARSPAERVQVLRAGLDQAPRVGEAFARNLLDRVAPAYDAMPTDDAAIILARAGLLEKALFVAAHFDCADYLPHLLLRFQKLLESQRGAASMEAIETLAGQCFRGLRKLGMRDEIDRLLALMADAILQKKPLAALVERPSEPATLRALLHVAGGWYYFGRDAQAEPVLKAARAVLFGGELTGKEHWNLACVYAATVGQAPMELAQRRLEELFDKLNGVRDVFTTHDYYSQSQVRVVEAVVLAVVSDDFTLGAQARRWLDDDEFLVRRRIHREMREALAR